MPSGTFGAEGLAANPTEKCPIGPIESLLQDFLSIPSAI